MEKLFGQIDVPVTTPLALGLTSGVTCGIAPGAPVTPDYEPPFKFPSHDSKLKSLILAQIERWRHALHMQVERQRTFGCRRVANG